MTDPVGNGDLVVVTGTTSGIGRAIAVSLATAGYRVVGIARRDLSAAELEVEAPAYHHERFDLSEIGGLADLVGRIVEEHGKPFALVNNAAIGTDGILPTMHNTEIERLMRVNVTSPIVLTKYLVRHMLTERRGRIVNISSIVARTGFRGLAAYAATKAAIEGFTRSLAREVGPRGVTVNAVAPGFVETSMNAQFGRGELDRVVKRSALGRLASADEVAGAVRFLLTEEASAISGSVLTVDAGSTA
jgi:3-oxoacyl-[acyl-carrier protein] reductase